ncbi:hypothetical protein NL449_28375, partial [Klebsiella pneumoniae]|nr:hypothetical protein [Klebsiella pneumoniae]
TNQAQGLVLNGNVSQLVRIGFNLRIGTQVFDSLFVNENGLVSFGAPIERAIQSRGSFAEEPAPFIRVSSLGDFRLPVIAPFYADL